MADLPPPEEAKAFTVPRDDGFRLDDHQDGSPVRPHAREPHPEEPIGCGEWKALARGTTQDPELLPQSEVRKPQRGRGLEQCGEGGEQYQHQVVHWLKTSTTLKSIHNDYSTFGVSWRHPLLHQA